MRDQKARQAVDPACRLQVEDGGEGLRHDARQAEEQDDGEPDDEGRRDDRQHRQRAQKRAVAEAGARDHQREDEAEQRGDDADQDGEEERVPGDAAARAARQAAEPPEPVAEQFCEEDAERIIAILGDQRAGEHLQDRHEDEERDDGDDEADRADDELVAADRAARGEPQRQQEQESAADQHGTPAHAELPDLKLAEKRGQPLPLKAAQADAEALQQEIGEAGRADGDEQKAEQRIGFFAPPEEQRDQQEKADRRQPEFFTLQHKEERRRNVVGKRPAVEEPREGEEVA